MDRRFKDADGDEWYVYRQLPWGSMASGKGYYPAPVRQSGFKFRNLTSSKMRFLKEKDAPKDLNLAKAHEEELRRLLDLARPT